MKTLTRAQLHEICYYLCLNRRVDEQLTLLYRQGKVVGGVYSGLGQEAGNTTGTKRLAEWGVCLLPGAFCRLCDIGWEA